MMKKSNLRFKTLSIRQRHMKCFIAQRRARCWPDFDRRRRRPCLCGPRRERPWRRLVGNSEAPYPASVSRAVPCHRSRAGCPGRTAAWAPQACSTRWWKVKMNNKKNIFFFFLLFQNNSFLLENEWYWINIMPWANGLVLNAPVDLHLWVDLRYDAYAVVTGDGEFVVEDPGRGGGTGLTTQVRGQRVQVSHVAVS